MRCRSALAVASCSILLATTIVAACVGSDPDLGASAGGDAASGDVSSNRDDGGSSNQPDGSPSSPTDGSARPPGILIGALDPTFKGGVLSIDGITGGAELVSASCTRDDQIIALADVHTGTTHSWYLLVWAPDGTLLLQRKVADGQPMDAVLGTDGRLYSVGVVSGFGNMSVFANFTPDPPPQVAFSASLGGSVAFRVAYSNDHIFAAGLTSTGGVRMWRFDRGAQLSGYSNDAGSTIVIPGTANQKTPWPTVAAIDDDAFSEGLVSKNTTLGAVGIHPDGTTVSFLSALLQKNITVPIDLAPIGGSALATAGFVDADAGTSAIARAFADGGADPSYGGPLPQLATSGVRPWRIQIAPDGFLLVASTPVAESTTMVAGLSRLLPDGSFDTTFGTKGVVAVPGAATAPAVRGLCWQVGHKRAIIAGTDNAGSDSAKIVLAAIK